LLNGLYVYLHSVVHIVMLLRLCWSLAHKKLLSL